MGKFNGILIVSDIDGTFLGNNSRIVPENIEAIEYFKQNGGMFTFATGRVHYSIENTIPDVIQCLNTYAMLTNGAYLYDFTRKETILGDYIDKSYAIEAMSYVREKYPSTSLRILTPSGFLTDRITPLIERYSANLGVTKGLTEIPISKWRDTKEEWYKIAVHDESADIIDRVRNDLIEKYGEKLEYNRCDLRALEMQSKGCTKASAISKLRGLLEAENGIKYIVYACGDFENDIEMLKAADHSVCPQNAMESVKKISEYELCHCDEGLIANLIRVIESEL